MPEDFERQPERDDLCALTVPVPLLKETPNLMPILRLARRGAVFSESAEDLKQLRIQFKRDSYIRLPELFEPELLNFIQLQIDRGRFYERVHEGIKSNKELCMTGNTAFGALLFLMNDEKLFQIIQGVTQCDRIRCFEGRVYRMIPGQGHHDSWHDDIGADRLVGVSINLSKEPYTGGILQIRDRKSAQIISEVTNVGIGDAVVFRLSPCLQHRITAVTGNACKTAFAGWFRARPNFPALLKQGFDSGREDAGDEISRAVLAGQ